MSMLDQGQAEENARGERVSQLEEKVRRLKAQAGCPAQLDIFEELRRSNNEQLILVRDFITRQLKKRGM